MLGRRKIVDGKAGKYVWLTYKEVYDAVVKVGQSIRTSGVNLGGRCGIFGVNCPEWIMTMQACNAHGVYCVPLYDTLGAGAVEFILCDAEISISFVEEKKIIEVLKTLPNTNNVLKTIVSFGKVTAEEKEDGKKFGVMIYSWNEFLLLVSDQMQLHPSKTSSSLISNYNPCPVFSFLPLWCEFCSQNTWFDVKFEVTLVILGEGKQFELPKKKEDDICTIMYTSGTTGDPKGVMISNRNILALVSGVKLLLESVNQQFRIEDAYLSYLPLAHIFDRVMEELVISVGASIGFWRGEVKLLFEVIGELKPSIFCAVPRVLDRIYNGLTEKIARGGILKHTLFNFARIYCSGQF